MNKKEAVLAALSSVYHEGQDIVRLGYVKHLVVKGDAVSLALDLGGSAYDERHAYKQQAQTVISGLAWVASVEIDLIPRSQSTHPQPEQGLDRVKTIVAVSSCKGGVGKSTVAVNLAFSLAKQGYSVGFFDADIYGPSLDTLIHLPPEPLGMINEQIIPKVFQGVKLMSFAYTQDPSEPEPAIMRGPMVSRLIQQLLMGTQWGELDYLILDLPPGTGDIHITLAQLIPIAAALIVTTPQALSLVDVIKGIHMFDSLNIPTVGVVENMSYFLCEGCTHRHYPFGQGAKDYLESQYGFSHTIQLPLDAVLTTACDHGVPLVLVDPDHSVSVAFQELAQGLTQRLAEQGDRTLPALNYADNQLTLTHQSHAHSIHLDALRQACQCALCTSDTPTGIQSDAVPVDIQPVGQYAIGVQWSDDHASLYPHTALLALTHA